MGLLDKLILYAIILFTMAERIRKLLHRGPSLLRQTGEDKSRIRRSVTTSLLDDRDLYEQFSTKGFFTLPRDSHVLIGVVVLPLKRGQRQPMLGEFKLETETQCADIGFDERPLSANMPETATITLEPTSPKMRDIVEELIARYREMEDARDDEVERERVKGTYRDVVRQAETERGRLAQEILTRNPHIKTFLSKHKIDPKTVTEISFTCAASSYVELP